MTATDPVQPADPAGLRFSAWLEQAPIGRTAARELLTGLGIQPERVRLRGLSAAVAWLTPPQVAAMDQAAARVAGGESVAQVVAGAAGATPSPAAGRDRSRSDADPGNLAAMAAALVGALQAARDPSQPIAPPLPAAAVPSPLARARALQQAAREELLLTSGELAQLTGVPLEMIEALSSGRRLQGYRLRRIRGSSVDPAPLWQLLPPTPRRIATDRDS